MSTPRELIKESFTMGFVSAACLVMGGSMLYVTGAAFGDLAIGLLFVGAMPFCALIGRLNREKQLAIATKLRKELPA